jgi:hypothetical protein
MDASLGFLPFNDEISSDVLVLEAYHAIHDWIPGRNNIRCEHAMQETKNREILEMHKNWETPEDFILFRIFGEDFDVDPISNKFVVRLSSGHQRLKSISSPLDWKADIIFRKNDFPYGGIMGHHWVLWYRCGDCPKDRSTITRDLKEKIKDVTQLDNDTELLQKVKFIWYENPKRNSLSVYFHVQVFWID